MNDDKKQASREIKWNYNRKCVVCGQKPTFENTHLCGPCCFGEADAATWHMEGAERATVKDREP